MVNFDLYGDLKGNFLPKLQFWHRLLTLVLFQYDFFFLSVTQNEAFSLIVQTDHFCTNVYSE